MTHTITQRVAKGAALLDLRRPGWFNQIDTNSLRLQSPSACVLGQLYGGYALGRMMLGLTSERSSVSARHGFQVDLRPYQDSMGGLFPRVPDEVMDEYDALTAEWLLVIMERRHNETKHQQPKRRFGFIKKEKVAA